MLQKRMNALRAMLNDPQSEVRQAAASSLDSLAAAADIDSLLKKLRNGEHGEQIAAAFALEQVNAARVYPVLLELLQSEDSALRLVAVQVLGAKKHSKTLAALLKMLEDPEPGIQAETLRILGGFADRQILKHLPPLLSQEEQVALAAIELIGQLGFSEGEEVLFVALRDQRASIRAKAAATLSLLHF